MYVDDIEFIEEAWELEGQLREWISQAEPGTPHHEQLLWDYEDVCRRIQELDPTEGTQ